MLNPTIWNSRNLASHTDRVEKMGFTLCGVCEGKTEKIEAAKQTQFAFFALAMSHSDDDLIIRYHPHNEEFSLAVSICSSCSAFASFSLVLTFALFPNFLARRIYGQMLFMTALCDMFASTGAAFGFPTSSGLCSAQSHMQIFFFRASFIWLFFIVLKLYVFQKYNSNGLSFLEMNVLCWFFSIVMHVAPVFYVKYGGSGLLTGYQPCIFEAKPGLARSWGDVWFLIAWFVPLNIVLIACAYMLSSVFQYDWARAQAMYPLGMLVLQIPNFIASVIENYMRISNVAYWKVLYQVVNVTYCISLLYGVFMTIVFFSYCPEARKRWQILFGLAAIDDEDISVYEQRNTKQDEIAAVDDIQSGRSVSRGFFAWCPNSRLFGFENMTCCNERSNKPGLADMEHGGEQTQSPSTNIEIIDQINNLDIDRKPSSR